MINTTPSVDRLSGLVPRAFAMAMAMVLGVSSLALHVAPAVAQSLSETDSKKKKDSDLEEVVVTGSLIPQVRAETAQPVTVITAADIQAKGFATIAEALQHSSFATGNVQNGQEANTFTPGAKVVSFFGLAPAYTKYLIDGRPIADYPALYNGSDAVTSISGIPTELVESIDILPGGQSSIYGSDAIAGVVNIHMKHEMDGPLADVRYGWTDDGGGTDRRITLADGFTVGGVKVVVGGQYEKTDPIWGYQRRLSDSYFNGGPGGAVAARTWLAIGLLGQANGDLYYMLDPALCGNLTGQIGGSVALRSRPDRGQYCGSYRTGFNTISNGNESTQGYLHASDDFNDNVQVFADVILSHDVTRINPGTVTLSTEDDSAGPYYYYADPKVPGDLLNLQQEYTPEEAGNYRSQSGKDTLNGVRATLGVQGALWSTDWKYLVDFTYTENRLTEATYLAYENEINGFYSSIFGANLGPDAEFGQPTYNVNYSAFYKPITPAEYASFTGYAHSYSRTEESLGRAELTNSSLFKLPGGDAGLAFLVEGGGQGWEYSPDPAFLDGQAYLYSATAGAGHRARYAGTVELRLPVAPMLTVVLSNRYDDYQLSGASVNKDTYNLSLEFRPLSTLLIRGKYGTAFKAPTLADEFQGPSGFYTNSSTDYYLCTKNGFTPATIANCPYSGQSYLGSTSGNTQLKPITAKVASAGIAWSPLQTMALTFDYFHWKISNEVEEQDSDQLLRTDSACLLGQLNVTSPTCVNALAQVQRDPTSGMITLISTPKINVAEEDLNVAAVGFNYIWQTAFAGNFTFESSYSNILRHYETMFAGDTPINLLESPFYSLEFKTKENISIGWDYAKFGTTLYVERYGRTPNYASQQTVNEYDVPGAGRLGTWTIANLSAKYEVIPHLVISANVDNVLNKEPPIDYSTPGIYTQPFNVENYNNYGRSYYVQANYKFGK